MLTRLMNRLANRHRVSSITVSTNFVRVSRFKMDRLSAISATNGTILTKSIISTTTDYIIDIWRDGGSTLYPSKNIEE